jgi:gliding motility-associated-like protein
MNYKIVFHLFLLVVLSHWANAAHIVGGEVTYKCININHEEQSSTFEIFFVMYRDPFGGGAGFDNGARFGIFRQQAEGDWTLFNSVLQNPRNIRPIPIEDSNPCLIVPPNVGLERGEYRFTITVPWIDQAYMIAWQRCCRNNTITNIVDPQSTGAAFSIEISPTAQRTCNNSPNFDGFPPIVICVNQPLEFVHSATDEEGDQLVYEFCSPLASGGLDGTPLGDNFDPSSCTGVTPFPNRCAPPFDEVIYRLPNFSSVNPLGGNPRVVIDPVTGLISGTPTAIGQYVVGVCVHEFREGELNSTVRRDFQFNVTFCEAALFANLVSDFIDGKNFEINSCGETTLEFENLSGDTRFIENYHWEFRLGDEVREYDTRNITVDFPEVGQYQGIMTLNKGLSSASCTDTAFITVNIFSPVVADFSFEYDTCVAGPVIFYDNSVRGSGAVNQWEWRINEEALVNGRNPSWIFTEPGEKEISLLTTDVNNCADSITKIINYLPAPPLIIIEPSSFTVCAPFEVTFNNLSEPIDDTYNIRWEFGDGATSDQLSPQHLYDSEGVYTVRVEIVSPIGCVVERVFENLIELVPGPIAGIGFTPEQSDYFDKEVQFFDQSENAVSLLWHFGDGNVSYDRNPIYNYQDTGIYVIRQFAFHEYGCADTALVSVDIKPVIFIEFPNAFTPNNDGLNDGFKPYGLLEAFKTYKLTVWNRWGDRVFYTTDYREAWNGAINNSAQQAPPGVYVYTLEYEGARGEADVIKGHITLIR